ncbi:BTB 2 domain containing protein [Trichuris trichiura]|uniref:BTB 2 domain containing protein n=1 Tax=Trichuris trichiura TaxID=36087 RepID=A0A077ZL50_TRITR|nr:BTB 2 domain containing protein [Trichuris trichiura]
MASRWVSLNVGGQTFVTSKQTLSRNRESFLFSRLQSDKDENGAFLIDRNPQYFAPVLDYLRHGKLIINKDVSEEGVLEEAEFYNLPGLVKLCRDRISSREGSKARASLLPACLIALRNGYRRNAFIDFCNAINANLRNSSSLNCLLCQLFRRCCFSIP